MRKRDVNEFEVLEVDMGYSTMLTTVDGRKVRSRAHRVRYLATHGQLPHGMVPDHLCKHRPCCNAAHMEPVTIAENNRRGKRTKLTPEKVIEIRARVAAGESVSSVARDIGMSQSHTWNVANGQYWADGLSPAWQRVKQRRVKG
jgi:hypothetical protein